MKKLKVFINNVRKLVLKNKIISSIFILTILLGTITVPKIFAQPQPVKSVEIFSEKLNYEKNEPGSWKVNKSAKWTEKGTAEITFDLETVLKENNKYIDTIFVLDVSGSMEGEKLDKVKADTTGLLNRLLSNDKNRAALITFDTNSQVISNLTNNKTELIEAINEISTGDTTNYYQALVNVDSVLKGYVKEDNRKCVVLFLTDGYPNEETPNEEGQYQYLKSQYPFISINGIQYEMGNTVLAPIKKISDNQYFSDMKTLNNILFEASTTAEKYDNFEITDYIDTDYFYIENKDNITANIGEINFDSENQKVSWNIKELKSGSKAKLKIKAKLKEKVIENDAFYPTNSKEEIKSKINTDIEDVTSQKTPVLVDNYKVIYDANAPQDCTVTGVPDEKKYPVFDVVQISDTDLKCEGYQFKGWKIINKDVKKINDEYFSMPEEDVTLKAEWSTISIKKSLEGEIAKVQTLQKTIADNAVPDNQPSEFVSGANGIDFNKGGSDTNGKGIYVLSGTENDEYPIYYYRGAVANNNVLFANKCWKIVRTTSTGGTKLMYNGLPDENGSCSASNSATIGSGKFNNDAKTPAGLGYTYGTYSAYTMAVGSSEWMFSSTFIDNNRYYSDTISFDNGVYSFENSVKVNSDSYENLVGKYVYANTNENHTSTEAYYVAAVSGSIMYYIKLTNGNMLDYYNKVYTFGNNIKDNGDGTYTLENPFSIEKKDWYQNYNNVEVGYYTCENNEVTCSNPKYIVEVKNYQYNAMGIADEYLYGNSFTYENGKYTLKDTVKFWNYPENYGQLKNHHYSCLNVSGVCTALYYIYYSEVASAYSIRLTNGDSVEDALRIMNSNTTDSEVKKLVDDWYENNMLEYTDVLEDTIWCNDRNVANKDTTGWNPNGGSTREHLYFDGDTRLQKTPVQPKLTCTNKNDSFTVSSENGNGYLKYPSALITADEVVLAGYSKSTGYSYLSSSNSLWTLTPDRSGNNFARMFDISSGLYDNEIFNVFGVKPLISVINKMKVNSGNGTATSPYILDLDSRYTVSIQIEDTDIVPSKTETVAGGIITLNSVSGNYEVISFKLNGNLIEGNSFEMPEEDVIITDIITREVNSN